MRAPALAIVCGLLACGSARHLDIEFTAQNPADVASIARVDVQVWSGDDCVCAALDGKAGCQVGDATTISFDPTTGDGGGGGFPAGKLVVRVAAFTTANAPIGLRIDCWCAPDRADQALVFPIGGPTMAGGTGCQ